MKRFLANIQYRGRYFEVEFYAKTIKDAANRINDSEYFIKTYCHYSERVKMFDNIKAIAYGHSAVRDIGHRNKIDFEDAKKIIDNIAEKAMQNIEKL